MSDKNKEEALKRSEELFRKYFELPGVGIAIVGPDGQWMEANETLCSMLGYTGDELRSMVWQDITPGDELARELVRYQKVAGGEKEKGILEKRYVRKDGSLIDVQVSASALREEDGSVDCFVAIVQDITERKKTEAALRQSEEKYRSIFDNSIEGIFQTTPEGRFLSANPALAGMYGFESPRELIEAFTNLEDQMYVDQTDRGRLAKLYEEQGFITDFETRLYRKDGSVVWISMNGRAVRDMDGKITRYEGTAGDITDRKRAEEALRMERDFSTNLIESSPVFFVAISNDGTTKLMNKAMLEALGYTLEEVMGKDYLEAFVPHADKAALKEVFSTLIDQAQPTVNENRVLTKDGRELQVEWHGRAMMKPDGCFDYFFGVGVDITERKRTEKALEKSAALLRSVALASPVGIAVCTADRVIVWVNDALLSISGYTPEEMMGRSVRSFYPTDEEFARGGEVLYGKVASGHIAMLDTRFVRRDGEIRDAHLSAAPIDPEDISAGLVFALVDITDRKQTEESLRSAHQQLMDVIEFLPDATFAIDHEKRVIAWNKAIEEMTGVKKEEMLGKSDYAYAIPFYGAPRPVAIDLLFEDNEDMANRYDSLHKVGHTLYIEAYAPMVPQSEGRYLWATAAPLFGAHRNVIGAIESIRDVTERRSIEMTLRESEERYRTAIESSNDGIAIVRGEAHVYVNKRFLEMFGYENPEDILGKPTFASVHPDDREKVSDINRRRQRGEAVPAKYEYKGIRKDGSILYVEVSATCIVYRAEPMTLAYLRDISERKSLEAQLLQSQKMEAIGTLAGGVAHDFNNILMAIMGYAGLIEMHMPKDDAVRTYVEQLLICTGKAANLTRSLLAFSRKQAMEFKPHNLNIILRDLEKLLRRLLPEDIEFKVSLGNDITVMADMAQMDQVLINLVSNARDAMGKGGLLHIETGVFELGKGFIQAHGFGEPGRYALISVTDTGSGMGEATQKKIFEPFFTTKEVGKGTGLGLSIVYGIVKQHGGYVTVSSEPGRGTTFCVYLPVVTAEVSETSHALSDARGGTETILFAEDNPDIRVIAEEILRMVGYTVIEAEDGEDAVAKFVEHRDAIDILVFDVVMPRKNGKEAYDEIRAMGGNIKALFMSGYAGDVVLDKGIHENVFDYISKPLSPDKLLKKVREVLDK
jgi:two-component system, cell cycle sensor histidine kinase and response regulator CckA